MERSWKVARLFLSSSQIHFATLILDSLGLKKKFNPLLENSMYFKENGCPSNGRVTSVPGKRVSPRISASLYLIRIPIKHLPALLSSRGGPPRLGAAHSPSELALEIIDNPVGRTCSDREFDFRLPTETRLRARSNVDDPAKSHPGLPGGEGGIQNSLSPTEYRILQTCAPDSHS